METAGSKTWIRTQGNMRLKLLACGQVPSVLNDRGTTHCISYTSLFMHWVRFERAKLQELSECFVLASVDMPAAGD